MNKLILPLMIILALLLVGCQPAQQAQQPAQIANPASVFCKEKGFESVIATGAEGGQSGICKIKIDNQTVIECDEWQFFRGECPACDNYCDAAVTPSCVGELNASGKYPDCKCDFICESKEEVKPVEVKPNEEFLVYFPWPAGETWQLSTNFHDENALDFIRPGLPGKVLAAADGTVLLSQYGYPNDFNTYSSVETNKPEDMGNYAILQHDSNTYTIYLHLQHADKSPVTAGDDVKAGQFLGWMGNTGWSHGEHLHFAVVDVSIFPVQKFIKKPIDSWGFVELGGSNSLRLNEDYTSQNVPFNSS